MPDLIRPADFFRVNQADTAAVLAPDAVQELVRRCRPLGIWVTLWNANAEVCFVDDEGPSVWTTLWNQSPLARSAVRDAAIRVVAGAAPKGALEGPWGRVLGLCGMPMRNRGRAEGAVLTGWVCRRGASVPADEDFARLCSQSGLDLPALVRMAANAPSHDDVRTWRGLFELAVEQARRIDSEVKKIESFSRNLEETYEELDLIYSVSESLPLNEQPEASLIELCNEVLTVTRTAGVAILLTDVTRDPRMSCIRAGRTPDDAAELTRLAQSIGALPRDPNDPPVGPLPPQIVRNHARDHYELAWALPWLEHAVAIPMGRERTIGVMLAINRTDGSEFNSVQIKFLRAVADRISSFLEKKRLYDDLRELSMGMLHALVSSIDAKDPYTCGHSERVAMTSRALARHLGFAPAAVERVYLAGLLHDVGKIGVPDAILCKPGKLTDEEFAILRRHPEIGARILSHIRQVEDLLPGILYHHERMDGRGYPHRLTGQKIPLLGRIICLADCFDAMTTNRTYRAAMPVDAALAEVRRCAGTQFDPMLAEKFFEIDLKVLLAELNAIRTSAASSAAVISASTVAGGAHQ